MLALQLHRSAGAPSPLHLVELADPEPAPAEIVIGVVACAVCRTDLQLVRGRSRGSAAADRAGSPGGWASGEDRHGRRRLGGGGAGRRGVAGFGLRVVSVLRRRVARTSARTLSSRAGTGTVGMRRGSLFAPTSPSGSPDAFDDVAAAPAAVRRCHRLSLTEGVRHPSRAVGSGCSGSARPPSWRSRSLATGTARSTCGPDRSREQRARARVRRGERCCVRRPRRHRSTPR